MYLILVYYYNEEEKYPSGSGLLSGMVKFTIVIGRQTVIEGTEAVGLYIGSNILSEKVFQQWFSKS